MGSGIELESLGLVAGAFYLLSHLTDPVVAIDPCFLKKTSAFTRKVFLQSYFLQDFSIF